MKLKSIARITAVSLLFSSFFFPIPVKAAEISDCDIKISEEPIYDEFEGNSLDRDTWLIAEKSWGGENGGVVPANVSVSNGTLKLEGHGNYYTGDVEGLNKTLPKGIRTGAAIATREYYSSGSYEVVAKVAPELGACSAIWTFMYEETPEAKVNHEIDIELPTANKTHQTPSFECARFNTYVTEGLHNSQFKDLPYAVNDGQFHKYRFDWHTGDVGESKRVDFYVDDIYICTSTKNVPSNASRFWIGIWFPCAIDSDGDNICDTGWTGTANFDTTVFEIDSVKITPYLEAGDTVQNESVPKSGWAADSFPEDIEAEHFDHVVNGNFSLDEYGWELNGDASISNGKAYLTSGSKTDTIKQVVNVLPKMTYTLAADVTTNGTATTVGVRNLNGTNNISQTITENGQSVIQFTTGNGVTKVELYAQVERYQDKSTPAMIDNISFISGKIPAYESELEPSVPSPDEPTLEPEQPATIDLIKNGSFDNGSDNWNISGSATIDTSAKLASGSNTDTISQIVAVEGGKKYTLSADIQTEGTEVIIGVNDYNGRYTEYSETINSSKQAVLTFDTASHIKQIEVFVKVLRYQTSSKQAIIDNIKLVKSSTSPTPEPEEPETPSPLPESNLIKNGSFDDLSEWTLSGNATINSGKLMLDSGSNTDTAKQVISVSPNTTYKITADIISSGCIVDIKVSNYNGKYSSTMSSYNNSCTGELIFTTGSDTQTLTVTFHVLRYQENNDTVVIDNAIIKKI